MKSFCAGVWRKRLKRIAGRPPKSIFKLQNYTIAGVVKKALPKFTCLFEDKKFNSQKTLTGFLDSTGDPKEIQLLQKMEKMAHPVPQRKNKRLTRQRPLGIHLGYILFRNKKQFPDRSK